jgi:glutathione synthase/RimK-type ligase-like ATP-grasp enzyme
MLDCIIATCSSVPDLDPDDRLLLQALRARGFAVETGVWNDPSVNWSAARLCLLRSTWDYPKRFEHFSRWLDATNRATLVRNPAWLVRWNSHKGYLRDLARAGIPTVPTAWIQRGCRADLVSLLADRGWSEAIVKPALGAAGLNVLRVSPGSMEHAQTHLTSLLKDQDVMLQPYLEAAPHPELSLVFIAGTYSHAVSKKAFDTKLAIGDAAARRVAPTERERDVAARAIDAVPGGPPLYGRVDIFRSGNGAVFVNEVELIEPALYLGAHLPAAGRLADAIAREL